MASFILLLEMRRPIIEAGFYTQGGTMPIQPFTSPVPFVHERVGAAAIYCSDGRYGEAMDDFLHNCLGLPHYDRVAIPGGPACLANHPPAMRERSALDRQIKFLIESHSLTRVVLIAHQDCGFYKHNIHPSKLRQQPLEQFQFTDLAAVAQLLRAYNKALEVDGYFARRVAETVRFDPVTV
jgi:hypothetical protein